MNRATLIGIDHYPAPHELVGCIKDASDLAEVLERHGDRKRKNFHCELVTSLGPNRVDSKRIKREIDDLFSEPANCVLFYYAGHGKFEPGSSKGAFLTPSGHNDIEELPFDYLLERANGAYAKTIVSTIIILDCCGAGSFAEASLPGGGPLSASSIGPGVTILAAANRQQPAVEIGGTGGLFTQYMVEGLRGSAADLRGRVTPASIYAHIDQMLGARKPRPVYKANVQNFIALRECEARVDIETLLALPELFTDPDQCYDLTPAHEPNRDNVPEEIMDIAPDPEKTAVFAQLQALNRQGLVVPVGAEHMYYAAIEWKSCVLTELGKHYRELAILKRI